MWPFAKGKEQKHDLLGEAMADMESFRKIGETFTYLGRTCIVTSLWDLCGYTGAYPLLRADYVDDHGQIHSLSFMRRELPALRAMNPDSGPTVGAPHET